MHGADPSSMGIYYDPVNFLAADNTRLDGWLVPVVDAKKVLEEKENIIGKRYPAVVLVHDFDGSRQQLLPMVRPLHEAGFVVLALNLRGAATISGEAQTFGIREAMDVKAAVEMLRRRPFVDPDRVALIGIGTGANACLLTAKGDDAIRTLVLTAPTANFDEVFATRVGADKRWLPPLRNLFRWTFQVMYGVDTSDLEFARFAPLVAERHVLVTDERQRLMEPTYIKGVQNFLRKHMNDAVAIAQ
jgi:alpha-beta hydrolase superfamily lysophospholipase